MVGSKGGDKTNQLVGNVLEYEEMNERIEHITKQVDEYFDDLTIEFSREAWQSKFAELIVRECIDIVSPYAIRMENFDGGHPIADLKKHFGVEE